MFDINSMFFLTHVTIEKKLSIPISLQVQNAFRHYKEYRK
jgi:hypothetical protein